MTRQGFFEKWNQIADVLGKSPTEVLFDQIELLSKEHEELKLQVHQLQSIVDRISMENGQGLSKPEST